MTYGRPTTYPIVEEEQRGKLESQWTLVDGISMHARCSVERVPDDAPSVVLVHGAGVSSRYFMLTAERLAPHYRVYAPDQPGFGKSGKPQRVLDVTGLADALAQWMEARGIEAAALLGNSFGCQIVVEFAVRHPQLIERGILAGPTTDAKARSALQQLWRWWRNGRSEPPSLQGVVLRDYRDAGLRRVLRTFGYAIKDPIEEKLPRVRVPMLVLRGSRDSIVSQEWAEEVTRLLPLGTLMLIPGAAHTVNYNSPTELVRAVRPFLNEGRRSRHKERLPADRQV